MNSTDLDPEDVKILTLARTARTRAYAPYTGHPRRRRARHEAHLCARR